DLLATYWLAPAAGASIQVEYLPGRPGSERIVGNGPQLMPKLFILCVLALLAVFVVLAIERRNRARAVRDHRQGVDESEELEST
ncbi:MAG TPA: hypothetical protein VGY55_21755, partial [Pirellulales bacterium]|nr:hypothetical protein [Pirellulales bacterium]